jgi:predicted double-glycine peptidase
MDPTTIYWFTSIASIASLAWAGGYYLGRCSEAAARSVLLCGLVCIVTWGWLHYHPAVAVKMIPLTVLTRLEGVGGVPFFMLLLGLAWARASQPGQKRLITWAVMFGAVFFIHGGLWMLQSTPEQSFASTVNDEQVMQSQEYSCVPAACAQALDLLEIPSSEQQMAELTQTRPGTGSTMLRAMQGLIQRLKHTPYTIELLEVRPEDLRQLPCPMLTPLRYETRQFHMVTIVSMNNMGVHISDPVDGPVNLSWDSLEQVFSGQVLVFVRR